LGAAAGAAGAKGVSLARFNVIAIPGKVTRVRLRRHLNLVAVHRAVVMNGHAVERDVKGKLVAIDLPVANRDGVSLGSLNSSGQACAILPESEGKLKPIAIGRLCGGSPCAGYVGGQRGRGTEC
jgi:hypothetical protein